MRSLWRSSAVWLRGSPVRQPRRPLGLLRPSRHGSSPERDNNMIIDHDIARNDCAHSNSGKAHPYLCRSPTPTKISQRTGGGLPPPRTPGFRNANASPTGAMATPRRRASAVRRSTSEPEIMPAVASARFSSTCTRRRRPARGIRRRIHRHALRACRQGRGKRKDQTRDIGPRLHLSRASRFVSSPGRPCDGSSRRSHID
jgi:hypothetical protein